MNEGYGWEAGEMAGITGGLQKGRSIWGRRGIGVLMEKEMLFYPSP